MTGPDDEADTQPIPEVSSLSPAPHRDVVAEERRRQRILNFLVPAVALLIVAVAVLGVVGYQWHRQLDGMTRALTAQRSQAQQAGQTPVAKPPDAVKQNPAQPTQSAAPPSGGTGPTGEQVFAAVVAAIQQHPEWLHVQPDPATLLADVDNWLATHAPKAVAPTPQQVYDAVLAVYQQHPPAAGAQGSVGPSGPAGPSGAPGTKGDKGDPGADASPEQIATTVEAWFQQHPLPVCPDGTTAQAHTWLTLDAGTISAVVCEKTSGS